TIPTKRRWGHRFARAAIQPRPTTAGITGLKIPPASTMQGFRIGLFLLALFSAVAIVSWPADHADATGSLRIYVLPSAFAAGGNVTDFGVHFDDSPRAAYDYGHSDDAWLHGVLVDSMPLTTRYMYWAEGSCRVRARMQIYDPWAGQWFDDYDRDIDILHLTNRSGATNYTQNVVNNGEYFYKVVGTASTCGTSDAHSHLAMVLSSAVVKTTKSDDTCWAKGSECSVMGGILVKQHANNATWPYGICPGRWAGQYATNKSGGVLDPYQCQSWSARSRSDGTYVFGVYY
nr:hypothetical protein [Gemmatimonadaceae bacterium]